MVAIASAKDHHTRLLSAAFCELPFHQIDPASVMTVGAGRQNPQALKTTWV
jgi:hypothetical protein